MDSRECPTCDGTGEVEYCFTCDDIPDNCTCEGVEEYPTIECADCLGDGTLEADDA